MPLMQYPNRFRGLGRPPAGSTAAMQLAQQAAAIRARASGMQVGAAPGPTAPPPTTMGTPRISTMTPQASGGGMGMPRANPTIRGFSDYTGKTMGPVGSYSRIPGFGRAFRG